MEVWSVPPRAKILQALSIVSSNQIEWVSPNIATVQGKTVQIKGNGVYANGNKNKYMDEKAIAMLMVRGKLPFSDRISEKLADFNCYIDCQLSEIEKRVKGYLEGFKIYEKEVDAFIELVNKEIRSKKFEVLNIKKDQSSILGFTR
jgi:hypothetical protein